LTTNHKIFFGDSRELLPTIKEKVALVVTSPPYNVNREYESYLETEGDFWNMMTEVFSLCAGVVEPFGKMAINFADRFANAATRGRVMEILYQNHYDRIMSSCGFDLWVRIIWDKVKVYDNASQHLAGPQNKTGQMRVAPNWEYVFVWRKHSLGKPPIKKVDMTDKERVEWTDSIWHFPSVPKNEVVGGSKTSKFPEELPRRLIKMYCVPGDLILDPFGGTCTTTKVARDLGRNSICIEKNLDMEGYIRKYLEGGQGNMFQDNAEVEYIHV